MKVQRDQQGRKLEDTVNRVDGRLLLWLSAQSHRSRRLDVFLRAITAAADRSVLWTAVAAGLAGLGGERGRAAAGRGMISIGLASAVVNQVLKRIWRRPRPTVALPLKSRRVWHRLPKSFAFPSGHAASAAAFATGASLERPGLAVPLGMAASAVGYSRVHVQMHYPGDVVAGAAAGVVAGLASGPVVETARRLRSGPERAGGEIPSDIVLVVSGHAGSARQLHRARTVIRRSGFTIVDEIPVEEHERVDRWLERGPSDRPLFVAAGGDGTVGTLAGHLAGTGAVLGLLPLGTSNDVARSLTIPVNPIQAARVLSSGHVSNIDAGRVTAAGADPLHFVHAASAGLNVRFARLATHVGLRQRYGSFTYAVAASAALRQRRAFVCTVDDGRSSRELRLIHLSVVNAPVFGGFLGLRLPGAEIDDRALEIVGIEDRPAREVVRSLVRIALHGPDVPSPGVHVLRMRRAHIHTDHPFDLALDGEIISTLPADFDVAAEALRVVTPRSFG